MASSSFGCSRPCTSDQALSSAARLVSRSFSVRMRASCPAMFAFNFMVTSIRHTTSELDNFNAELSTAIEHKYVDNRALADEVADAIRAIGRDRQEVFAA